MCQKTCHLATEDEEFLNAVETLWEPVLLADPDEDDDFDDEDFDDDEDEDEDFDE